ncbi:MAG: hypothetical protein JWM95_3526 [Gemmatimonadetes bacterium]|nr:hypothetical protein [Gemmatimonadota bacterium]
MPPRIAKLAGLGAYGACLGIAGIYALFVFITRPGGSSGLDPTLRFLAWFTVAGVILALIGIHVMFGHRLIALSKGEPERV